jgi:mannosylglycerate hydrolase
VEADASGRVTIWARREGVRIEDALRIVSEGDRGDEYNFDPVPGGEVVDAPARARVKARRVSGGEVALRLDLVYRVPESLAAGREARSARRVALPVRLELRLLAGLDRIDLEAVLDNTARDHRLRLHCRAPFAAARFEVESAFEVAERPIAPPPDAFGAARPSELPIGAGPQRRFATLLGARDLAFTVANRGLAEVEALPGAGEAGGEIAITLVRAVGWLSRGDLRLRPGPAGPVLRTPGAQVPGPHHAELSLRLHAADDPHRAREAHGFAAPPLAFAIGAGGSGPLVDGARLVEVDDPRIEVSAIEPREGGATDVRLVNASAEPTQGAGALGGAGPSPRAGRPGRAAAPGRDARRRRGGTGPRARALADRDPSREPRARLNRRSAAGAEGSGAELRARRRFRHTPAQLPCHGRPWRVVRCPEPWPRGCGSFPPPATGRGFR